MARVLSMGNIRDPDQKCITDQGCAGILRGKRRTFFGPWGFRDDFLRLPFTVSALDRNGRESI